MRTSLKFLQKTVLASIQDYKWSQTGFRAHLFRTVPILGPPYGPEIEEKISAPTVGAETFRQKLGPFDGPRNGHFLKGSCSIRNWFTLDLESVVQTDSNLVCESFCPNMAWNGRWMTPSNLHDGLFGYIKICRCCDRRFWAEHANQCGSVFEHRSEISYNAKLVNSVTVRILILWSWKHYRRNKLRHSFWFWLEASHGDHMRSRLCYTMEYCTVSTESVPFPEWQRVACQVGIWTKG